MGSVNISITDDVYSALRGLKRRDESFSEVIRNLVKEKDISKCYGILADLKPDLAFVEAEALKARKQAWKRVQL